MPEELPEELVRPKRKKTPSSTKDYILMRLPEDDELFAVVKTTRDHEKYTLLPTDKERELGIKIPVYERTIQLISPYYNHLTGEEGESCTCLHWTTQKTRCVHLKKFFELNPHLDPK